MNTYLILILVLLTGIFCLDTLSDYLNLGRLSDPLPTEFQGLYDIKKYETSLSYQKETIYFQFFQRSLFYVLTVAFIVSGGFEWIDLFARSFGLGPISTGLIFVGVLSLLLMVISLPFSIYDTFILEEKYGFNKTTPGTFITDFVKGIVISAVLGGLVFSGIVYFFEKMGPGGWLYSWIAVTSFQLILAYLAPALLMPLFNKFSPLPPGPLRESIEDFARKQNFKLSGIFTMDSSKRSTKSNAFFTGFGKFRRLVLFDTLISKQTPEELVAILAHEIGHFKRKHILKTMVLSIFTSGLMFYIFSLFINNPDLFQAFQMEHVSVYASLVFIGLFTSPFLRVLSLFTQKLSRKHEFEADEFAVKTYGQPNVLISALKKLSIDNLSHLTPHPLKVALDYTHPPILKRIEALRNSP